jgi:hypothetical protein
MIVVVRLTGRLANGHEGGKGVRYHAVETTSFEGILGGGETDLPSLLAAEIMGLKWAYDGTTEDVLCERHGQLQEVIAAILSNGSWRIEYVPPSA